MAGDINAVGAERVHPRPSRGAGVSEPAGALWVRDGDAVLAGVVVEPVRVERGGALFLIGVAPGGVVVGDGGYARIDGQTAAVEVHAGGHLTLRGVCHGPAIAWGGRLLVQGDVHGPVISHDGAVQVGPDARVACAGIDGSFLATADLPSAARDGERRPAVGNEGSDARL